VGDLTARPGSPPRKRRFPVWVGGGDGGGEGRRRSSLLVAVGRAAPALAAAAARAASASAWWLQGFVGSVGRGGRAASGGVGDLLVCQRVHDLHRCGRLRLRRCWWHHLGLDQVGCWHPEHRNPAHWWWRE